MERKPDCKQKLIINVSFKPQIQNTQLFRDDEPLRWNLCTAHFHQSLCCFNIQSRNLSVFSFCLFFFCCIHGICNVEVTCMLYYACFFFWLAAIETLVELFYNLLLLACVGVQILETSRPFLSNLRLIAIQLLGGCFFVSTQTEEISYLITRNFQRYLILNLSLW